MQLYYFCPHCEILVISSHLKESRQADRLHFQITHDQKIKSPPSLTRLSAYSSLAFFQMNGTDLPASKTVPVRVWSHQYFKGLRKHEVIRNCQRSKANLFNILLLSPLFTHETAVLHVFMIRLTGSVRNFPIIYGISEKLAYNIRSDMTVNKQCCGGSYSYYQAVSQEYKHSLCLWIGKLLG